MVKVVRPTLLYCCRLSARHSPLHRRFQIGLFVYRTKKRWQSRHVMALVIKYGAEEDRC